MQAAEKLTFTAKQYLELESRAETKSELVNGEIYAMAGAKPRHNALTMNISTALNGRLRARGSPCIVFNSDQRVYCEATNMFTYPDVSVACGPQFHAKHDGTLVNPRVLIEVLSRSTAEYDRSAKFEHYQTLPSFVEYVLVSQGRHQIEHRRRLESGQWLLTSLGGDDAVLELPSLECSIPLREIYAQTDQLPGEKEREGPFKPKPRKHARSA